MVTLSWEMVRQKVSREQPGHGNAALVAEGDTCNGRLLSDVICR